MLRGGELTLCDETLALDWFSPRRLPATLLLAGGSLSHGSSQEQASHRADGDGLPLIAGIAAAALTLLVGNLGTIQLIYHKLQELGARGAFSWEPTISIFQRWAWAFRGFIMTLQGASLPMGPGEWYWNPSRVVPPLGGNEITEFPLFTFIYSDLHAHMIAMPLALLAVSVAGGGASDFSFHRPKRGFGSWAVTLQVKQTNAAQTPDATIARWLFIKVPPPPPRHSATRRIARLAPLDHVGDLGTRLALAPNWPPASIELVNDQKLVLNFGSLNAGNYDVSVGNRLGLATSKGTVVGTFATPHVYGTAAMPAPGDHLHVLVMDHEHEWLYGVHRDTTNGRLYRFKPGGASGWTAELVGPAAADNVGVLFGGDLVVITWPGTLRVLAADTLAFLRRQAAGGCLHRLGEDRRLLAPLEVERAVDACLGAERRSAQVPLDVVAADHVENEVDAFAAGLLLDHLDEVVRLIIDRNRCAQLSAFRAFFGRSGRREDARAEFAGELDGGRADAARAAMDQEALPGPEVSALEHVGPDREKGLRQGRGLDHAELARDGQALWARGEAEFGIAPASQQGRHLVSDLPTGDVRADRHDLACDLQTRQIAGARRRGIAALALEDVRPVDACRRNPDQHLALAGLRHWALGRDQNVRPTWLFDLEDAHFGGDLHEPYPAATKERHP